MSEAADVIVVGAGLHGCSAALHLARRGKRVIVLERRYAGRHSSGINAGGVRTLGRDPAEIALSIAGMELWHGIAKLVDDDCGFTVCGQIKVAESAAEMAKLESRAAATRALGFDHEELIDQDELFRLVPAIARHCVGGLTVRTDGAADPYRTTLAFKRKAESLGVRILEDEGVVGVERLAEGWEVAGQHRRYRAPFVVNCTGAWAARFAAMIGDAVPLSVRASMMIVTERMPAFVAPVIGAVGRKLSFKQTSAGTVVIGGGQQGRADLDTEHGEVVFKNLSRSAEAATALFPIMKGAGIVRTWCGVEAQTPDQIPVIGWSPNAPGVAHAFGYSGHGFQLGPIVGSAIADLIAEGSTNLPIAPFCIERFSKQREAA